MNTFQFTARKLKGLLFIAGGLVCSQSIAQDLPTRYASTITPDDLRAHLTVIAHDSLEGRATGSPGQKKAAAYVSSNFQRLGLKPAATSPDGSPSYYQQYNLYRGAWEEAYIHVGKQKLELNGDFYINGLANIPDELKLQTVFAGYGIEDPAYNDYSGISVNDKAVVILEGEPAKPDGSFLLSGDKRASKWSGPRGWEEKTKLALSKGARAVILVTTKSDVDFDKEIHRRLSIMPRVRRLSLRQEENSGQNISAFSVSRSAGAALLGVSEKKFLKAVQKINSTAKPVKIKSGENIRLLAKRQSEVVPTENVAALLEGTDKKNEIIVVSAHLDHIGISSDGQINNGADDDGSGTVALLEIAEAFAKAKADGNGPRRSILFLNVTGEEMGLLGSEFYSENPLFPVENHVANLNIDMIGRVDAAHQNDPDYVYLIGSDKLSSELHAISESANEKYVNLKLDYTFNHPDDPNRFYYRSDHYNFAKKGIPVVFYFTGVHEDYHRPGDDVEKILFDRHAKIVKLIFHTTWELANREERIKVDSNKP